MAGFLETLKESILGHEVDLPVCSLERRKPLNILYTYYDGKPRSHRLEFRKGNRPVFEILLPQPAENLAQIYTALTSQDYRQPNDGSVAFGFWFRLTLWLLGGKMVSCRNVFPVPEDKMHTPFGDVQANQYYRLAYFKNGAKESIIIIYLETDEQTTPYRRGKQVEMNWQKLSMAEAAALADHLRAFLAGEKFAGAQKERTQKT